ncbi:uncharacterized protein LOC119670229 [Teleopsis dalmanni]|uniref:uncharacterized protein LOC119670229 n=1 Tax=Teleopsis dalmanni TaxID=139649 RepID=UPI0018CF6996|nr:uncharacterized protein LOC119670229 [Teleopsis dalmanni]
MAATNWNKSKIVCITEESSPAIENSFSTGTDLYVVKLQNMRTIIEVRRFMYSKLLPNGTILPLDFSTNNTHFIDDYINYCKTLVEPTRSVFPTTAPNIIIPRTNFINVEEKRNQTTSMANMSKVNAQTQTICTRSISTSTDPEKKVRFVFPRKKTRNCCSSDNDLFKRPRKMLIFRSATNLKIGNKNCKGNACNESES